MKFLWKNKFVFVTLSGIGLRVLLAALGVSYDSGGLLTALFFLAEGLAMLVNLSMEALLSFFGTGSFSMLIASNVMGVLLAVLIDWILRRTSHRQTSTRKEG